MSDLIELFPHFVVWFCAFGLAYSFRWFYAYVRGEMFGAWGLILLALFYVIRWIYAPFDTVLGILALVLAVVFGVKIYLRFKPEKKRSSRRNEERVFTMKERIANDLAGKKSAWKDKFYSAWYDITFIKVEEAYKSQKDTFIIASPGHILVKDYSAIRDAYDLEDGPSDGKWMEDLNKSLSSRERADLIAGAVRSAINKMGFKEEENIGFDITGHPDDLTVTMVFFENMNT